MVEYRDASGKLCFDVKFTAPANRGNPLETTNWTLDEATETNCRTSTQDTPFIEANTDVLQIPYGQIQQDSESSCFMADLRAASEDLQNWTLLAGKTLACH